MTKPSSCLERLYKEAEEDGTLDYFLEALRTGEIVIADQTPEQQEATRAFIERLSLMEVKEWEH